jgi:rfaE bifunctional protein kinase chain/domain
VNSRGRIPPGVAAVLPRSGFSDATVMVVGDLMLDRYVSGDVHRISPEAPVPVLTVHGERVAAGGAANVALNVAGLKARTHMFGVVGKDATADRLIGILSNHGIDPSGIIADESRPTTRKTRVMCGTHQIVRLDEEVTTEISGAVREQLLDGIRSAMNRHAIGAVILSDYSKGVLGVELTRALIDGCAERGVPVLVDPKKSSYSVYRRAACITPNVKEFHGALAGLGLPEGEPASAGARLREVLQCQMLLVTQGAAGMTLVSSNGSLHLPALAEEVFDVSGAGDTVIATMATALGHGIEPAHAAALANIAASIVVRKLGTAPIRWQELEALLTGTDSAREASLVDRRPRREFANTPH